MKDVWEEEDDYDPTEDPNWCDRCQGRGKVTTADYESYFGVNYKPCPVCHGSPRIGEPPYPEFMNEPNKSAQALGRMGKGKPKNLSPEERQRRREHARGLAAKRWPVKGEPMEGSTI